MKSIGKTSVDSISELTEDNFIDYTDDGIKNNGFKPFSTDYALGRGFAFQETAQDKNYRKLSNELNGIASNQYHENDLVNVGYIDTLLAIKHRNSYIKQGLTQLNLNTETEYWHIPSGDDELSDLAACLYYIMDYFKNTVGDEYPEKWMQLYYPAHSACYAYEPKNLKSSESLNEKFKKHNWFLPSLGILARLKWWDSQNRLGILNPLSVAKNKGLYNRHESEQYGSSTVQYSDALFGTYGYYNVGGRSSNNEIYVCAVCAF